MSNEETKNTLHLISDRYSQEQEITTEIMDKAAAEYFRKCSTLKAASGFMQRAEARKAKGAIKTGFAELDDILGGGLYSGLYVIGGETSIGKTAFMLQIADQIAMSGKDVLYFSLEMETDELIARSLSREIYLQDKAQAMSALECYLWKPKTNEQLLTLSKAYDVYIERISPYLYIFNGNSRTTIEGISETIDEHRIAGNNTPVIFVDYLQLIEPRSDTMTDIQRLKTITQDLKVISRELETPVIVVSSYNRNSYGSESTMAAFKGSGDIEYSADVAMCLEYDVPLKTVKNAKGEEIEKLDKDKVKKVKEDLKDGKFAPVRASILKNRKGKRDITAPFMYNAKYNIYLGKSSEDTDKMNEALKKVKENAKQATRR